MLPSGLTARARGVSAKKLRIVDRLAAQRVPRHCREHRRIEDPDVGPTDALGRELGIAGAGHPAIEGSTRCWPRCAVVMKARSRAVPAKTMSRGSSPTSSVRTVRAGDVERSTIETLSDRWFTTQTSLVVRAATATGSSPTGTDSRMHETRRGHVEDLEVAIGRVHREEPRSVRTRARSVAPGRSRRRDERDRPTEPIPHPRPQREPARVRCQSPSYPIDASSKHLGSGERGDPRELGPQAKSPRVSTRVGSRVNRESRSRRLEAPHAPEADRQRGTVARATSSR